MFWRVLQHKSLQLYKIAMDKREFDRLKGLLDGTQVQELSCEKIIHVLKASSISQLKEQGKAQIYLLHDPCDIRKPHSEKLEDLGIVRDLDGNLISGYRSMNTIALTPGQMQVSLMDHVVYSNRSEQYLNRSYIDLYEQGQWHEIPAPILKKIYQEDFINLHLLFKQQLRRCSDELKASNPSIQITHIQDREFDSEDFFRFIDQDLKDKFISRIRKSRKSNQSKETLTPKGKISKKRTSEKIKNKTFKHSKSFSYSKIRLKKKVYQNVKCQIDWDTHAIPEHRIYTIVRIQFYDRQDQPIYKDPMLLISNIVVKNEQMALGIYRSYLLRSKIEALFKFLKQDLGWENIQVRDFKSIQNLLALGFYVSAYFYEIKEIIQDNSLFKQIADFGGGKGKMTKHYFMNGLAKLCNYKLMLSQLAQLPKQTVKELIDFVDIQPEP